MKWKPFEKFQSISSAIASRFRPNKRSRSCGGWASGVRISKGRYTHAGGYILISIVLIRRLEKQVSLCFGSKFLIFLFSSWFFFFFRFCYAIMFDSFSNVLQMHDFIIQYVPLLNRFIIYMKDYIASYDKYGVARVISPYPTINDKNK